MCLFITRGANSLTKIFLVSILGVVFWECNIYRRWRVPTLDEFLKTQEEHYAGIRNAGNEAHEKGVECDSNLKEQRGGFFIVLRHQPEIERAASLFSRHIAKCIPAIEYSEDQIYTSLCGYGYEPGLRVNPKEKAHRAILSDLSRVAYLTIQRLPSAKPVIEINYKGFIHSRHVAIARGFPNQGFVDLAGALSEACILAGIKVKPAWGAHMTLSRFTGNVPRDMLGPFFALFRDATPFGISRPTAINIGYADWSEGSHYGHFVPYAAISFSRC